MTTSAALSLASMVVIDDSVQRTLGMLQRIMAWAASEVDLQSLGHC